MFNVTSSTAVEESTGIFPVIYFIGKYFGLDNSEFIYNLQSIASIIVLFRISYARNDFHFSVYTNTD